jgi:gamma-glutamylputrescine oxidase
MRWFPPGPLPMAGTSARAPLTADIETDVCIVGGGVTGIATAYELAARGTRVAVVEAGEIGSGETGASGGQLLVGTAPDIRDVAERYGEDTARFLWSLSVEGLDRIKQLARGDGAPCGLRGGHIVVAETEAEREYLQARTEYWKGRLGYRSAGMMEGSDLRHHVSGSVYIAGTFDANGGHLEAPAFARNLAAAAERMGARLHEGTRSLSIDAQQGRVRVAGATVTAQHIVAATGPWIGALLPQVAPYMASIYSYASWLECPGAAEQITARTRSPIPGPCFRSRHRRTSWTS